MLEEPNVPNQETTRQKIITAALHLFGLIGYSRATTRKIAEAADVNEVTIFRIFGTKKDLLLACMQHFNASGFAENFQSNLSGDVRQDIIMMANMQVQDTAGNLDFLRLLMCEARQIPELLEAVQMGSKGNRHILENYFHSLLDNRISTSKYSARFLSDLFSNIFSIRLMQDNMFQTTTQVVVPDEAEMKNLIDFFLAGCQLT